jgi:hypothetical protein
MKLLCWLGYHRWRWDWVDLGPCDLAHAVMLQMVTTIQKGSYFQGHWYEYERTECKCCKRKWLKD